MWALKSELCIIVYKCFFLFSHKQTYKSDNVLVSYFLVGDVIMLRRHSSPCSRWSSNRVDGGRQRASPGVSFSARRHVSLVLMSPRNARAESAKARAGQKLVRKIEKWESSLRRAGSRSHNDLRRASHSFGTRCVY